MEIKYTAASKESEKVVYLCNFLRNLEVIPNMDKPMTLFPDNNVTIIITKDSRHHKMSKDIDSKYAIIRSFEKNGVVVISKVTSQDNFVDPFTKTLVTIIFERHIKGLRSITYDICTLRETWRFWDFYPKTESIGFIHDICFNKNNILFYFVNCILLTFICWLPTTKLNVLYYYLLKSRMVHIGEIYL